MTKRRPYLKRRQVAQIKDVIVAMAAKPVSPADIRSELIKRHLIERDKPSFTITRMLQELRREGRLSSRRTAYTEWRAAI